MYCQPYSLFASSSERSIVLWQAQTGCWISELSGHTAVVTNLATDIECVADRNLLLLFLFGFYFGASSWYTKGFASQQQVKYCLL
jgi:hypothetical protein